MAATVLGDQALMSLSGVTKTFGDFVALRDLNLDFRAGQVHALLGANGSGKSTLVKVMSGVYQPEHGTLQFDGARLAGFGSPADAAAHGIRVVHQEAPLIDTLTVAEAVAVFRGFHARSFGKIGWRRLRRDVQDLLDRMDVPVRASQPCSSLVPADRAGLALAIVVGDLFTNPSGTGTTVKPTPLAGRPRLLIVDEVTAAIPDSETERHLQRLRHVADAGLAVVMVTHRLNELTIADDVTILRAGSVVYRERGTARRPSSELVGVMVGDDTLSANDVPHHEMAAHRAGPVSTLWAALPRDDQRREVASTGTPAISVAQLSADELDGCTFSAAPGEIVGFAGLRSSGVEELPRILAGGLAWGSGEIRAGDTRFPHRVTPRQMIDAGVTAIPSDRLRSGGVASLTLTENATLPALGAYWHRRSLRARVMRALIDAFDVRPPEPQRLFGTLSGGNQQKVLLGKWLALRPSVLVLDDPTYGVDPGARETIFAAISDAARRGVCVLFFSTEPEQLVRVCHRVLVLRNGVVATELSGRDLTLEQVIQWSYQ